MNIRDYTTADHLACLNAFKSNVPLYFTVEEVSDFDAFLTNYETQHENEMESTHYYVIEKDNQIIGCGGFGDRYRDGIITLTWGLIHCDFHKQGFGAMLLDYRLSEIKKVAPNNTVFIDTTQHSAPFFEKFGFKTTKITDNFYSEGLHRYDMERVPIANTI